MDCVQCFVLASPICDDCLLRRCKLQQCDSFGWLFVDGHLGSLHLGIRLANDILFGVCLPTHIQIVVPSSSRNPSTCSTATISNWSGLILFGMGDSAASGHPMGSDVSNET